MIADKLHYTEYIEPRIFILLQYSNQRMLWGSKVEWTLIWFIFRQSCFKIKNQQSSNRRYYSSVISENNKQVTDLLMITGNSCSKSTKHIWLQEGKIECILIMRKSLHHHTFFRNVLHYQRICIIRTHTVWQNSENDILMQQLAILVS
jgi:hypothetical protein